MGKRLIDTSWLDTCDRCGEDLLRVETEHGSDEFLYEGDSAECSSCGLKGSVMVTDDYQDDCKIYVSWDEFSEEAK